MGNIVQSMLFKTASDPDTETTSAQVVETHLLDLPLNDIDGKATSLREIIAGYKLTILVNVASK